MTMTDQDWYFTRFYAVDDPSDTVIDWWFDKVRWCNNRFGYHAWTIHVHPISGTKRFGFKTQEDLTEFILVNG